MTSHTKPGALKPSRNRVLPFIVVISGRIVFTANTLSEAYAWRDGHGAGAIYQRVVSQGKAVPTC